MKKIILSIALVFCVCFLNAQDIDTSQLPGKWIVQKIEVFENGKLTDTNEKDPEIKCHGYVEFFSDGRAVSYNFKEDCTLRRKDDGTYTVKDGVLLVTENTGEEAIKMKIIRQDANSMMLSAKEVYEGVAYKTVAYFMRYKK